MEREVHVPEIVLNSGHKMPILGMGTSSTPLPPCEELTSIFLDAIVTGYRHFDTAALYGSEEALGGAVAAAIEQGLIKSRDHLFITSKLWCTDAHPELVLPALKDTLRRLRLDYVDLYLVHLPVSVKQGADKNFSKEDIVPLDMKGVWKAMEEVCKLGLAKSIGVSNFSCKKLSHLLQIATIPPAVNQVEMNVTWQQKKLLEFCKQKEIHVSAWSPLGGTIWGNDRVMQSPVLQDIAAARDKTIAQVALRWIYEQGASVIVKSFNKERMRQNLQIFDWELGNEEVLRIQQIPQKKGFTGDGFIPSNGSVEEFWDGEI